MLTPIIRFSLRHPGVVTALACVVLAQGIYSAWNAKFDVFPEFAPPQVVVPTEAPGLSPEDVEALVTLPIENALNGVDRLDSIRSQSVQGLSVVTATFKDGTDVYRARQVVGERLLEAADRIPRGIGPPVMAPLTSSTSIVLSIGLTSETQTLQELRALADWTLRPRLLGIAGVSKVVTFGGEVRQLQVSVRSERLVALRLGIADVVEACRRATGVRGAGFIDTPSQRISIQTVGQALTPEALAEALVSTRGDGPVRLRDVASVVWGSAPKVGDASILGTPGVLVSVSSQFGANTLDVTGRLETALHEIAEDLRARGITLHPRLFRPATFIEQAVGNVTESLVLGGILVSVVLFLFLFNLRIALISLTAIPLSLLGAVILLTRLGVTLNTLTLGGLAMAIGEVVDDAIIDVENIHRRLGQNAAAGSPVAPSRILIDASLEVRSSVVYATFVVALVFLPVLTMSGIQGRLFAPLGLAYVLAILASLLVALTVTPALSSLLLGRSAASREPRFVGWLKSRYSRLLGRLAVRPRRLLVGVGLICVLTVGTLPFFGGAFLPELREGQFIVHMALIPGTSIEESMRLGRQVTVELLKNPHIESVAQQVGRAELADDTWGTHYSEFAVALKPLAGEEAELVQSEIRGALVQFPGAYFAITPFLTERIEETIAGVTAEVAVKVFGEDLDALDASAREIAILLEKVGGAVDVQVGSPPGMTRWVIRLDPGKLKTFRLSSVDVLEAVQAAYQGVVAGQVYEGSRVLDLNVILDPAERQDPETIGALTLRSATGEVVPLRAVADLEATHGRYEIQHEGARRRQTVTCNVRGRDAASFAAEAKARIASEVKLPGGVYFEVAGAAEAEAQARREILLASLVAAAGIVLLLSMAFRRPRHLLLVLANLPFALVGGVLAVFFTGGWLSVGALVGFVTLFGISTRNSILLISHYEHLVEVEGRPWGLQTAMEGASERLLPILMTALVTGLGLLPLAIGSGEPGREVEGPMAIVILGGLVTSTALNLLVLPVMANVFMRTSPRSPP